MKECRENKIDLSKFIGSKIKYFRELRNMTQDELAQELSQRICDEKGISRQSVSRYETGDRKANQDILYLLSDIFDITISDFFPNKKDKNIIYVYNQLAEQRQETVYDFAETQLNEQNNVIEFPDRAKELIRGRRMAGGSALHVDDTDARKEVVSSALIPKGADELVEVVGKSMEPLIKDGEEVYIRYQPSVENGEIAIVRIESEGVTCKRVYNDGNTITLKSENPDHDDMHFSPNQVTVLGKVLL